MNKLTVEPISSLIFDSNPKRWHSIVEKCTWMDCIGIFSSVSIIPFPIKPDLVYVDIALVSHKPVLLDQLRSTYRDAKIILLAPFESSESLPYELSKYVHAFIYLPSTLENMALISRKVVELRNSSPVNDDILLDAQSPILYADARC